MHNPYGVATEGNLSEQTNGKNKKNKSKFYHYKSFKNQTHNITPRTLDHRVSQRQHRVSQSNSKYLKHRVTLWPKAVKPINHSVNQ